WLSLSSTPPPAVQPQCHCWSEMVPAGMTRVVAALAGAPPAGGVAGPVLGPGAAGAAEGGRAVFFTAFGERAVGGNCDSAALVFAGEISPSKPISQLPVGMGKPEVTPTMPPLRLVRGVGSTPVALSRSTAPPHAPPPATPT